MSLSWAAIAAAALGPALSLPAPAGYSATRPLLWETPVSWAQPAAARPAAILLNDAEAKKQRRALELAKQAGARAAAESLAGESAAALVLLRAELKAQAGDLAGARRDYESVLASKNMRLPRALAWEALNKVLRQSLAQGDKGAYGRLLEALRQQWLNREALELAAVILADPGAPELARQRAAELEPIFALRLGLYERAAELWAQPKDKAQVQWLAQTENRRGNPRRAAELRLALAAQASTERQRRQELTAAWNFLAKAGLYEEALALAEKEPFLKKKPDYQFRLGLAALWARDYEKAARHFQAAAQVGADSSGARYFLARVLESSGREAEAAELYRALLSGPPSYYRVLAQGRLEDGGPLYSPALAMEPLLETGPSGSDSHSLGYWLWLSAQGWLEPSKLAEAAEELLRLGPIFPGPAKGELNRRLEDILKRRDWSALASELRRDQRLWAPVRAGAKELWARLAASAAAAEGDYHSALRLFRRLPLQNPEPARRAQYPLVYARAALEAWRAHGLPPALLMAVIRTESTYQPDIISRSNARGLMQLLPSTAAELARRLGHKPPDPLALFEPELNIRYGSWYLAALIEGFGSPALALAGYNGGPFNIRALLAARPEMPLDIFIENLPFAETCDYVKRVFSSRYLYELAYLGRGQGHDLSAPPPLPNERLPNF